jgi:predicted Zn-dependent protease
MRAPALVDAGRSLRSGQAAIARHDYVTAAARLERAHEAVPSSRKVTISLAEADFGANRPQAALDLLRGMKLTEREWSTLTQTMPASIQRLFQRRPRCRTYEPARRLTLSGPRTSLVVVQDHELEGGP